jgi:hypothetical protein
MYGHIASKCDNLSESVKEVGSVLRLLTMNPRKDIKIGNFEGNALIDTGSELTLMRVDQYVKMRALKLSQQIVEFRGIGSERSRTLGKFSTDVLIDGESYGMAIHIVSDTVMPTPIDNQYRLFRNGRVNPKERKHYYSQNRGKKLQ